MRYGGSVVQAWCEPCVHQSVLLMAESQPLDEFTIDKVHWKSWAQSMQIGMRNKVLTKMTMTFNFPDTGVERSLSFVPSFACMKEVHASIPVDDDDKVMEFNDYHLDYKTAVEQKIQHRKAKSAQHKVNFRFTLCFETPNLLNSGWKRPEGAAARERKELLWV